MNTRWTLHEAKNKFSEVVDKALEQGPQIIMRRGKDTAVLIAANEFQSLSSESDDIVKFFSRSPLKGFDLDLTRDQDTGREIKI